MGSISKHGTKQDTMGCNVSQREAMREATGQRNRKSKKISGARRGKLRYAMGGIGPTEELCGSDEEIRGRNMRQPEANEKQNKKQQ